MKFPFLASVIIFCIVIHHATRRGARQSEASEARFWERERTANATRKKPLDNLKYIKIPYDTLPMNLMEDDPKVHDYLETIRGLEDTPIVNLTGYTNTDLKLEYGAPNITLLSRYDQSYTLLVSTLQLWADCLLEAGYTDEAVRIMEFAVSTETDVSRTYYKLAEYYISCAAPEKIHQLKETAQKLRSSNRDQILQKLSELSSPT